MTGEGPGPAEAVVLDLLLERGLKEPQEQVLLSLVGRIVVEGEDHRVHELGGLVLGHLKNQLGQIGGVGLKRKPRDT